MRTFDAISHMLEQSGMSKRALSLRLDKSENYLVNAFASNKDMSAMNLARLASHMGYTLKLEGHGEALLITSEPFVDQDASVQHFCEGDDK